MNNTEKIHRYLDSELNDVEKQTFFADLANDSELRNEFEFQKEIENHTSQEASAIKVPVILSENIFSKLHINYFSSPIPTVKYALVIILLLSLTGITTNYYWDNIANSLLGINSNTSLVTTQEINKSKTQEQNHANSSYSNRDNIAYVSSIDNSGNNNIAKNNISTNKRTKNNNFSSNSTSYENKYNISDKNILANNSNNTTLTDENSSISIWGKTDLSFISYVGEIFDDMFDISNNTELSMISIDNLHNINHNTFLNSYYRGNSNWLISFTKQSPTPIGNSKIAYSSYIYDNIAINISYKYNRTHKFGIEFGKELFSQQFSTDNGELNYDQIPQLNYFAMFWKYSPSQIQINDIVFPFTKVLAGGTVFGPVVKLELGTNIKLYNNLFLVVAGQYGNLLYQVDSQFYNSQNYGSSLGLQLNF